MKNKTLIVIPAYNSSKSIGYVLRGLPDINTLIVDDGSADSTLSITKKYGGIQTIKHENNLGVGMAIKSGIDYAIRHNYRYIITIDSDGQHSCDSINDFIEELRFNDFVIGNRFSDPSKMPHQKLSSNFLGNLVVKKLFNTHIKDISCGFRGFKVIYYRQSR